MNRLRRVTLRVWAVIGTAVVIVVSLGLVVAAYAGWTVGLGTHDRAVTVVAALTAGALFAGLIAAILALAAYWSASGTPDLSVEITFPFSKPNAPVFRADPPRADDGLIPIPAFKQVYGRVVVRNASDYAARNPGVRIRLHGLVHRHADPGWTTVLLVNGGGVIESQWDGGADEIIHGGWERVLPPYVMSGSFFIPGQEASMEVTVVADGVAPRTTFIPVRMANDDEAREIDARRAKEDGPVSQTAVG